MRTTMLLVPALALAACQAAPDRNSAESADVTGNISNYAARVIALPVGQRDIVFLRAIRDAGLDCQGVTKSERLADTGSTPTWRAVCTDGTAHLVQVTPGGTALVVSRVSS